MTPSAAASEAGADPVAERPLPGGLVLRPARPADLEQIGALLVERGEEGDDVDHRLVVEDPEAGWATCAVVVDGDRVVSTTTLLDETVRVGGVSLTAGQVELVATDTAYEGRGLVRELMRWAHDLSAARGHLLQVMVGIPYFYRLFGYEYAVDIPPARALVDPPAPPGAGSPRLRRATADDVAALEVLQDHAQQPYDLAVPHSAPRRRWLLAHGSSTTWVLDRDGRPVAAARVRPGDDDVLVAEAAALDDAAAEDLLRGLVAEHAQTPVQVVHRALTVPGRVWGHRLGEAGEDAEQYYGRIPALAPVLDALAPELHRRLVDADLAEPGTEILLSTFREHVRIPVTDGGLGPVSTGGVLPWPAEEGGAGVAPDQLAPLLLGPLGMAGLARRRPDVYPGPRRDVFEALFPPLTGDVLTYYLPW